MLSIRSCQLCGIKAKISEAAITIRKPLSILVLLFSQKKKPTAAIASKAPRDWEPNTEIRLKNRAQPIP